MVLFYTFPFLDANVFDEVGDKDSLQALTSAFLGAP
jgi:hypothetical protein